uniref:Beta-1,4-glucuronyltransferase 1 n=2 Tax=Caenorhabditis tropicalis TaxID=1561998 RepID=A0A1I7UU49_9PELO
MVRLNRTAIYSFLLVFIVLMYLQRLRNKYFLQNQESEDLNLQKERPPLIEYTIEKFGVEGDRQNYSIQTEKHSDEYCIGYSFLKATETFREPDGLEPVTLATHATSDMIDAIEMMPQLWDGPISIGVFVDYHSSNVLEFLSEIHRCDIRFRRKMTVHFAFRRAPFQAECPLFELKHSNRSCQEFYASHEYLRNSIVGPFQLYPSNLMRNIARKGAQSDIHFIMDGDMIPSQDFATKIKPIANEIVDGKSRRVLAIRRFETSHGADIPRDHRKLLKSKRLHKTFEFHHRFFAAGHHIDGLDDWFRASGHSDMVSTKEVAYPLFSVED